ncbi:MBL fold metallo-hydrolase [Arenimonas terrae]|uniref:MBL fold metallo-hydrolase n=1 Tax=Arenimonas terrae TaxID=2546226 RepID=A0A5C4RY72_9GAMM|nr:MBL fold metallo-hydrolase [Arenimonas terrae]TNJ35631.1 MBL fold metallo-hydrolase [Arenimonas terrae]
MTRCHRSLIVLAVFVSCVLAGCASTPASPPSENAGVRALAPGVFLLRGDYAPPRQPDGNSVVFEGPDGLLVVDTGRHAAHARRLLELAAARGKPVQAVLNTHWHLDHIGNNPALRAAFPRLEVHASAAIDGALVGFLADYRRQLQAQLAGGGDAAARADWQAEIARIDAGAALRPDRVVQADAERMLAGRPRRIGHAADAVTAGDLWLWDAASGVLAAGDLVTLPAPFFDTACPRRWSAELARIEDVPFTTLVPGHGAPMDRDGFRTYRRAFGQLLACADGTAPAADCISGWQRDAAPLLPDPAQAALARDLLAYYFQAVLRGPRAGRHCPVDGSA